MARQQILKAFPVKTVAVVATPETLVASQRLVKSVAIQGLKTNTDFVYVGDSTAQNYALAPGKSLTIHGDALDHGGFAYLDLLSVYIKVDVGGEGVSFVVLEGI